MKRGFIHLEGLEILIFHSGVHVGKPFSLDTGMWGHLVQFVQADCCLHS